MFKRSRTKRPATAVSWVGFGHDPYARRTLVVRLPGGRRLEIPFAPCGHPQCVSDAAMRRTEEGVGRGILPSGW